MRVERNPSQAMYANATKKTMTVMGGGARHVSVNGEPGRGERDDPQLIHAKAWRALSWLQWAKSSLLHEKAPPSASAVDAPLYDERRSAV